MGLKLLRCLESREIQETSPYQRLQHFPLRSAYLCQDCEAVGNNANTCPACASTALSTLATALQRVPNQPGVFISALSEGPITCSIGVGAR